MIRTFGSSTSKATGYIEAGWIRRPTELVAQFDYAGTSMVDWRGQVDPLPGCAPELGINTASAGDIAGGCRAPFDSVIPGVAPTVSDTFPLVGPIIQAKLAPEGRQRLATGMALPIRFDSATTGAAAGCTLAAGLDVAQCSLRDTGVPFQFVDHGVRNNFRYFYAVTAFDVNSVQSGPTSLESARRTHAVTPRTRRPIWSGREPYGSPWSDEGEPSTPRPPYRASIRGQGDSTGRSRLPTRSRPA